MKKKVKRIVEKVYKLSGIVGSHHTGAYAAQAAYFFVLSLIPILLLLLTMVQFTPVTKMDIMNAVMQVFPKTVEGTITSIVNEVYAQSGGVIPVTLIVALWSAGKGVLSVNSGLNCIYDNIETRNLSEAACFFIYGAIYYSNYTFPGNFGFWEQYQCTCI